MKLLKKLFDKDDGIIAMVNLKHINGKIMAKVNAYEVAAWALLMTVNSILFGGVWHYFLEGKDRVLGGIFAITIAFGVTILCSHLLSDFIDKCIQKIPSIKRLMAQSHYLQDNITTHLHQHRFLMISGLQQIRDAYPPDMYNDAHKMTNEIEYLIHYYVQEDNDSILNTVNNQWEHWLHLEETIVDSEEKILLQKEFDQKLIEFQQQEKLLLPQKKPELSYKKLWAK